MSKTPRWRKSGEALSNTFGAGGGGWLVAWGRLAGRSHVLAISKGDAFSREERHDSKICEE
jgi:hypothetical protein